MQPRKLQDATTRLVQSAGALCTPIEPVQREDSLYLAASEMAHQGVGVVAVESGGVYVGVVTEQSLAQALAAGADGSAEVSRFVAQWPTVPSTATGAEILRILAETGAAAVVVLDGNRATMGLVRASRLYASEQDGRVRKAIIGGMATPFGVYLTNGNIGAGAKGWPLVATGALLFCLLAASTYLTTGTFLLLPVSVRGEAWVRHAGDLLNTVFFLGMLRAIPLAGIHGAEHKVVHAIERGEPLTPLVVSRMPRVHPRCGTNLAVGAGVFIFLAGLRWTTSEEVRLLVALVATLALWRPVGSIFQYFVTTKPPTMSQIESGIKAGEELLTKMETAPRTASLGKRLLSSGLFHIIAGSAASEILLYFAEIVLRVPAAWRVFS